MKCELAQETIVMAVYSELPDDRAPQFEQHLAGCERCRHELEAVKALSNAMALLPVEEPPANLIARSRLRLEEALDALPRGTWLARSWRRFGQSLGRLRGAPAAVCAVVVASLTVGGVSGYEASQLSRHPGPASQSRLSADAGDDSLGDVANVSSIVQRPNSENVEVIYNRLEPVAVSGSLDDPKIRHLLLIGARNRLDPEVKGDSLGLLADECRAGHSCNDPVRDALLVALRYDKSAAVRLKALEGLQPYVADDLRVRDTVLESLLKDPDPKVRTQAIGLLEPVGADSSVREVLHTVAARDDNPEIRLASRQVLNQIPQVQ